jgi:hypothetical protein
MFNGVYTCIYFVLIDRVGEGIVPLAIVVYIDGSFVKHKIPVKPILRDGPQSKVGGFRQSLCVAGAGHDAQPAKERNPSAE